MRFERGEDGTRQTYGEVRSAFYMRDSMEVHETSPNGYPGSKLVLALCTLASWDAPLFSFRGESGRCHIHAIRPQFWRDNPLNLSISISGGKETNKDSLSSGE